MSERRLPLKGITDNVSLDMLWYGRRNFDSGGHSQESNGEIRHIYEI